MKSNQETFDLISISLLKQGKLSINITTGNCKYRSTDGFKCAAGHLIPDYLYSHDFEDHPCYIKITREVYTKEFLSIVDRISQILIDEGHDPKFVSDMQEIHDSSCDIESWKKEMIEYAKYHGLSFQMLN